MDIKSNTLNKFDFSINKKQHNVRNDTMYKSNSLTFASI